MTLVKYNPSRELSLWNRRFGNFLDDPIFRPFFGTTTERSTSWQPVVDIFEEGDHIVLTADLPGVKKEDLSIDIENRVLTLKGKREYRTKVKEKHFYRRERSFGSFQRAFSLPADIKTEEINAEFKDGILRIDIPKPEKEKSKQVTIH